MRRTIFILLLSLTIAAPRLFFACFGEALCEYSNFYLGSLYQIDTLEPLQKVNGKWNYDVVLAKLMAKKMGEKEFLSRVKEFVEDGGVLLILVDTENYYDQNNIINRIASTFGILTCGDEVGMAKVTSPILENVPWRSWCTGGESGGPYLCFDGYVCKYPKDAEILLEYEDKPAAVLVRVGKGCVFVGPNNTFTDTPEAIERVINHCFGRKEEEESLKFVIVPLEKTWEEMGINPQRVKEEVEKAVSLYGIERKIEYVLLDEPYKSPAGALSLVLGAHLAHICSELLETDCSARGGQFPPECLNCFASITRVFLIGDTDSVKKYCLRGDVDGCAIRYANYLVSKPNYMVIAHEFGHTLGLGEEYCRNCDVIPFTEEKPNQLREEYGCRPEPICECSPRKWSELRPLVETEEITVFNGLRGVCIPMVGEGCAFGVPLVVVRGGQALIGQWIDNNRYCFLALGSKEGEIVVEVEWFSSLIKSHKFVLTMPVNKAEEGERIVFVIPGHKQDLWLVSSRETRIYVLEPLELECKDENCKIYIDGNPYDRSCDLSPGIHTIKADKLRTLYLKPKKPKRLLSWENCVEHGFCCLDDPDKYTPVCVGNLVAGDSNIFHRSIMAATPYQSFGLSEPAKKHVEKVLREWGWIT